MAQFRGPLIAVAFVAWMFASKGVALAAPSDSGGYVPTYPTQYVQSCTAYEHMSAADFATAQQKYRDQPILSQIIPTDASILSLAATHLPGITNARVVIRGAELVAFGLSQDEMYSVIQFTRDGREEFARIGVTKSGDFADATPVPRKNIEGSYALVRELAEYMMLNELLASDAEIPYRGCALAATLDGAAPGVNALIVNAMVPPAPANPTTLALAQSAYTQFAHSKEAAGNELTLETLHALGDRPVIALVYRDVIPYEGKNIEFDIVRLSHGPVRTYASMSISDGKASMGSPALCRVGDGARCARYYVWP